MAGHGGETHRIVLATGTRQALLPVFEQDGEIVVFESAEAYAFGDPAARLARTLCLAGASAAGLPIETVYPAFHDTAGLEVYAAHGRRDFAA